MNRLLSLALLAAACAPGFEPQYRVTDLRLLAVRAQVVGSVSADVVPGDAVQLEALVANPLGRAPLSIRWFACAPTGTDALPPCLDEAVLRDPAALAGTPGVLALGEGEAPSPIAVADLAGALDGVIRLATEEPTHQCRLYAEVPVVAVVEADGRREVAVKRVRLTPRPEDLAGTPLEGGYVLNLNPAILDVYRTPAHEGCLGGTSLAPEHPFPSGRTVLCGHADEPGQYNVCGPAGERTLVREARSWQWYTTGGEFPDEDGIGNATGAAPEFERPAGPFTLWVIVRDGRGGEGWARRDVGPAP